MAFVPPLERICGSWNIISRETGKSVCETFSKRFVEAVNEEKYFAVSALQYLGELNQSIKEKRQPDYSKFERKEAP